MIAFINRSEEAMLERLHRLGGDEEKVLLLAGDGVYLASAFWRERLEDMAVEEIYAVRDDVEARQFKPHEDCRIVGYDKIVDLLFSGEQIVSL